MSPEPFEAGSEIYTIVTYDHETHFDVNNDRFGGNQVLKSIPLKRNIGNIILWISRSGSLIACS